MKPVAVALAVGMIGHVLVRPGLAAEVPKARETVLHSFGSGTDGRFPEAGLIDAEGTLYSITSAGGANNEGTVFAIDPATGAETVVHAFGGGADGLNPQAGVIDVKGTLYGTTARGGTYGSGTVFALDPTSGAEKLVYSFCGQQGCADGMTPDAGLMAMGGILYGTTTHGGSGGCQYGCGTVFSLDPVTGSEKALYAFQDNNDGQYPFAGLIGVKGKLYGTTLDGGDSGTGAVFALDPKTGAETVLYSFGSGTDGQNPEGSLIDAHGMLYGATLDGGAHGKGTVFALDLETGAETVVHSFCGRKACSDGAYPFAGLIDVKGTLYGTTSEGGNKACFGQGCGTVFSLDPNTGAEKILYSFQDNGGDGQQPVGNLIDISGTFYGTSSQGGDESDGTVFALTRR